MKRLLLKGYLTYNSKVLSLINFSINLLIILFVVPIVNQGVKLAVHMTAQSYITPANVNKFLFSPYSIVFFLIIILVTPLLLISKFNSLLHYCTFEGNHKISYPLWIIIHGFVKTIYFIRKKKFSIIYNSLPFYIFTLFPVFIGVMLFSEVKFPSILNNQILNKLYLVIFLVLLCLLFFPSVFVTHYGMIKGCRFSEAFQNSKKLFTKNSRKILFAFFSINFLLVIAYILIYYLLLILTALAVFVFSNKSLAVAVFLSAYPTISLYATLLFGMIAFTINFNLITSLYFSLQEEPLPKPIYGNVIISKKIYQIKSKYRYVVNGLFICLLFASFINFYLIIHNHSLYFSELLTGIQISSHRGDSHLAPENTIPALEHAIIANSDYAEIDVQETKDGVLVLLHDKNLIRTSGINQNIWDMNLAEVKKLDVGSWFGNEYSGTQIPTLSEVLEYCKGKIKLNIEVKLPNKSTDIQDKLVELIEEYDYVDQCVVSSSNYAVLVKIKKLNGNIKTGYILSAVYGNFYDRKYVDFYSIRYNYISSKIVELAHQSGKEVQAWTVNSSREMERLKALKVDCIITDNPTHAREVLYSDDMNDSFINLINRMFRNRSLYSFRN